jgi:hypothetical protein
MQELLFDIYPSIYTLPDHLSSPPVFSGVRVTRYLVLYVRFVDRCLSFCTFSFPQIASQCWANVGILLTTSLDQRWQITLAQRDFAHRAYVGPTCWQFVKRKEANPIL